VHFGLPVKKSRRVVTVQAAFGATACFAPAPIAAWRHAAQARIEREASATPDHPRSGTPSPRGEGALIANQKVNQTKSTTYTAVSVVRKGEGVGFA